MLIIGRSQRGDTIIEVMLSIVIFSAAVVGSIAIMNRGVAMAQRSLEVTLVRQQIDAQIALLSYANSKVPSVWDYIINNKIASENAAKKMSSQSTSSCPSASDLQGGFFMTRSAVKKSIQVNSISQSNYKPAITYSMVDYLNNKKSSVSDKTRAYGMWIYAVESESISKSSNGKAYDMHIMACWNSVGVSVPMTISTVVRMYNEN